MARRVVEKAKGGKRGKGKTDPPPLGHNSESIDNKATFLEFVRRVSLRRRDLEEAQGRYRAEVKAAKSAGLSTKLLLEALAARARDPDELAAEQQQRARYFAWLALPVGTQAALFAGAADDALTEPQSTEQALWEADDAGYRAGRAGHPRDETPHPLGSVFHVEWDKGYLRGQAFIAAEMGPDSTNQQGRRGAASNPEDAP